MDLNKLSTLKRSLQDDMIERLNPGFTIENNNLATINKIIPLAFLLCRGIVFF
jgi:hypothetical protein